MFMLFFVFYLVTRTVTSKGLSMWRPLADLTPVIAYTFGSLYWIINSDALSRHPLLSVPYPTLRYIHTYIAHILHITLMLLSYLQQ